MVLEEWDEELDPWDRWVVLQGSDGETGEKGKKLISGKREKEGGTFRMPGELLFLSREEAQARLREVLKEGGDGDNRNDRDDEGDQGDDKREGADKGVEVWGDKGGKKGRDTGGGGGRGLPGASMRPGNPPLCRRGSLHIATREKEPGGQGIKSG